MEPTGHPTFASPLAAPIALSPVVDELYVVNTAADTLDVIDTTQQVVSVRVAVGIDPVAVAVRPDGKEIWVSNHVSDTVNVIDVEPSSPTRHQVIATITAWLGDDWVTDFDEPVGIAFASNQKAYVALSSRNRIAVVDVASRTVTKQIQVHSQEPRAIAVRDGRLYVIPFESGNTTEFSGCLNMSDPGCTFSITDLLSNSNDVILTRNMVADIVRRPGTPDRDLFVYDTADESLLFEVSGIGTLLYGIAIDSHGQVFIAQTEARNDANGAMGTAGHGLPELENRAFLNQVARVDCALACTGATVFDIEPLPPIHPLPGEQLATPFGIQVSDDDATVVSVAAASSRLFTMDAETGAVIGRTDVGAIPRGLALESDPSGAAARAWVLNAIENSVSVVDVSDPGAPQETARIALVDPSHPDVKHGRIAFNDAAASTTGTFACASCHPDGHTDQLLWNVGAPPCVMPGCDQIQPRVTMPVRGLRDTLPLHWDGVPGDPFGGINAVVANSGQTVAPNCTDEHSCFRNLVDGSMSGIMCDQSACPTDANELGLAGAFSEADRDAIAVFLRSVPYPPARSRRLDDRFSALGAEGFRNLLVGVDAAHPGCSRAGACHSLPFWAGTNTPGTGMDAPTFRGMTDRHLLLPNGRAGMWALIQLEALNEVAWDPSHGPDELYSWGMTFGSPAVPLTNRDSAGTGPFPLFQLFEEGSTGFSAVFGRQLTLDAETTSRGLSDSTEAILQRMEEADTDGVVNLRVQGIQLGAGAPSQLDLEYESGRYESASSSGPSLSSRQLLRLARRGALVATATARIGPRSDVDHPQPALWLPAKNPNNQTSLQKIPELTDPPTVTMFGRHVAADAIVLIDGQAVDSSVACATGGVLPNCDDESLRVDLDEFPTVGDHAIQLATPGGLISNEVLIILTECPEGATLPFVQCRAATLLETVEESDDLGTLHARLEKSLVRAHEALRQARLDVSDDQLRPASRNLRRAVKATKRFERILGSGRGQREIPVDTRTALSAAAADIRDDLTLIGDAL